MTKKISLSEVERILEQNQKLNLYRSEALNRRLVKTSLKEELESKEKSSLWIFSLKKEILTLLDIVNEKPDEAYFVKDYPRDFAVGAPFCRLEQR